MSQKPSLINTPLERGGCARRGGINRFSGFRHPPTLRGDVETAKAVAIALVAAHAPLKRGVNERSPLSLRRRWGPSHETSCRTGGGEATPPAPRAKGIDPFKSKFAPTEKCAEARA